MEDNTLNTFGIKMSILSFMGSGAEKDKAEDIFQWVMEELDIIEAEEGTVTSLHTVQ